MTRELKQLLAEKRLKFKQDLDMYIRAYEFNKRLAKVLNNKQPNINYVTNSGSYVLIDVDGLSGLHTARQAIKSLDASYEDKLSSINPINDYSRAYARYEGKTASGVLLIIDMWAPIDNFPVKLKDGCGFKAKIIPEHKEYVYVCEVSK